MSGHPSTNDDLALFQKVIDLCLTDEKVRRSGPVGLFIRSICGTDHPSSRDHRPWEAPVMGLINCLRARDGEVHAEIQAGYQSICVALLRDFESLRMPGDDANRQRALIAQLLLELQGIPGHRRFMYDEVSLSLAMQCWLYMLSNWQTRQHALRNLYGLFGGESQAPRGAIDRAVETISLPFMTTSVKRVLLDSAVVDEALEDELWAIEPFATSPSPFSQLFTRERVYEEVSLALWRQIKHGAPENTPEVLRAGHQLVYNMISNTNDPMSFLTDLLGQTPMLDVAAKGLLIAEASATDLWCKFIERIIHCIECTNKSCPYRVNPLFLSATRTAVLRVYSRTLHLLRSSGRSPSGKALVKSNTKPSTVLKLWIHLGACVGVSEDSLYTRWRIENECCNPMCAERGSKVLEGMKKCSGCQVVWYCGAGCQGVDWRRHKKECRVT